jgi:hypothetical protein
MKPLGTLLLAMVVMGSLGVAAEAVPITTPEGTFDLQVIQTDPDEFDVTYTADMTVSNKTGIYTVGFKITNNVGTVSLTSGPATWGTDAQADTGVANGCSAGGNGFVCSQGLVTLPTGAGAIYTWVFHVDIDGNFFGDPDSEESPHIKASFTPNGNLSEDITLSVGAVPEPATLLLVGSGLAGLGYFGRKRRARNIAP